jgi:hypothetical protein
MSVKCAFLQSMLKRQDMKHIEFTPQDEIEFNRRGVTRAQVTEQINKFINETRAVHLERPCTQSDGIVVLSPADCHRLLSLFENELKSKIALKFVPASGAASRMFKHLHNYSREVISDLTEEFILNFQHFPFVEEVKRKISEQGLSLDDIIEKNDWEKIFDFILDPEGLHYDAQLKGMVIFHQYENHVRTAFEEHLHEAIEYARMDDGKCKLHFTIAPQHLERVKEFLIQKSNEFPYQEFEIEYSIQPDSTDTVALTKEDAPVRDPEGNLVFRPAGHGALIHNLQNLEADIIFIKNIDNVTTDRNRADTSFYKKIIAGLLLDLQQEIEHLLVSIEEERTDSLESALEFIQLWFQPGLPLGMSKTELIKYAVDRLERPLRICGMVRNEGEPGGGPFWVRMTDGHISKQIVERSQVDIHDALQAKILSSSTHFNPVDIVCSIKNRKGINYDLSQYIDYSTGFISEKFQDGQVIKALELPGLWNGAMALWNTIFVEVPVSTFNPVKTVNDLLRPGHQN